MVPFGRFSFSSWPLMLAALAGATAMIVSLHRNKNQIE